MNTKQEEAEFLSYLVESTHRALLQDGKYGALIYAGYALIEYYLFTPEVYLRTWAVRLFVGLVCGLMLLASLNKHPLIQQNLRFMFLFGMSVLLNSITVIYAIAYPVALPLDVSLAALTLVIILSIFPMLGKDAMIIGAIFLAGFGALLAARNASETTWYVYAIALGVAYGTGTSGAFVGENNARRAFRDDKMLREEKNRADRLLTNIFPSEVAKELKTKQKFQATLAESASVMFCDIVDFTHASTEMPPEELVDWLNHTFSKFDRLTARHGCEKIKTIGDAYMAVCGVPSEAVDHADRILSLALAINEAAQSIRLNGQSMKLRIGINSGPVVAGVIGESRFAYDLWGDTVNIASRMEALAPPGRIQITEATRLLLTNPGNLEKVPGLPVKGKGTMDTWLVAANPKQLQAPADQEKAA